jgi:hypothetical protein
MGWRLMGNLRVIRADVKAHFDPAPTVYTVRKWVPGAPASDHHAKDYGFGVVVAAIDVMLPAGAKAKALVRACVGRRDLAYVIHDGLIYSARYAWKPRPYTRANKHRDHVHISSRHSRAADADRGVLNWRS